MELDSDYVDSRCAAVSRVVDKITAHSDLCAVRVLLFQAIIYTDSHVRDVAFALVWDVLVLDENNSVCTFADSKDALSKTSEFPCVGCAPHFLVLGVHQ